ncbi:unnamed protein product [Prorocentrum cordatum]|uniref:Uncharacterized protein n=1 Tax=Prorocentrum cordatum TaxID=2364126 RepID=A0ABN9PZW5_9DINO|nr:unnamed protein product [Polarella glacialis]
MRVSPAEQQPREPAAAGEKAPRDLDTFAEKIYALVALVYGRVKMSSLVHAGICLGVCTPSKSHGQHMSEICGAIRSNPQIFVSWPETPTYTYQVDELEIVCR